jgi:ectoine hydroxylase-related dioxygenase (phytanoyl-CoA dioxygenase family)
MRKIILGFLCCMIQMGFTIPSDVTYWQEKKDHFQKYGYVWLPNFYSREQVALLRSWAERVDQDAQTLLAIGQEMNISLQELARSFPQAVIVVPERGDSSKVCRAEDLLTCYPDFHAFVQGTLTTYLSHMLEETYVLFKDKINFKWPGGGAFTPHQDFPAFEFFGPREHVTAMVCIDAATIENGCLYIAHDWKKSLPNSIFGTDADNVSAFVLPYVEGGKNHGSILPEICEQLVWLPIEASPGDVVFFDSFVPHYSEVNQSIAPRRALFLTHNRLREGEHREAYYRMKRADPDNPMFHFGTPTQARTK